MSESASALTLPAPVPVPGKDMPVESTDERETFARIKKEAQPDEAAEQAFMASKVHLAITHPTLHVPEREVVLAELTERLEQASYEVLEKQTAPVPGGVGYGVFYNGSFKSAFALGTSLYFEIVCPTSPGGNVNTWLYLTAMNGSAPASRPLSPITHRHSRASRCSTGHALTTGRSTLPGPVSGAT